MKLTGSWHPLMSDATTTTATSGGRIDNSHSVVSNDILITSDCRTHILTGPNYSGKSVLLKQIGLTAVSRESGPSEGAQRRCSISSSAIVVCMFQLSNAACNS